MHWRDQIFDHATFRGAPFFVESAEEETGRRTVAHEAAFSEKAPFTEDLGVVGKVFQIEAYVIGDEYMTARDKLISALASTSGPGELVHPYRGSLRCAVGRVRIRESREDGGFAVFSIEFIESSADATQSTIFTDSKAKLKVSAGLTRAAVVSQFVSSFDLGASPYISSVTGTVAGVTAAVSGALSKVTLDGQAAATISDLAGGLAGLVSDPTAFVERQVAIFAAMGEALLALPGIPDPSAVMLGLYDFDAGTRPVATTPSGEAEQQNFDALQLVTQRLALVASAEIAVEQTFVTFDDAVRIRTAILALIEEQAKTAPDDTFDAFQQLQADLANAVPGEDEDLPRLLAHTPPVTLPSLVLAHNLYGDLDAEEEIVTRNRVRHPGFVTGGVELEVLSRE